MLVGWAPVLLISIAVCDSVEGRNTKTRNYWQEDYRGAVLWPIHTRATRPESTLNSF